MAAHPADRAARRRVRRTVIARRVALRAVFGWGPEIYDTPKTVRARGGWAKMRPLGCGSQSTCCRAWHVDPRRAWDGTLDEDGLPVVPGASRERMTERIDW